ncbi:sulfatase-like hydrolase/transferase [Pontiella agarivorans]|uniref:Sulfatase-like hydrolase/transferase n=1 Tax=Pontiella agarivorans TaxID=3038953 RepID=A0ABU5N1A9_9BACT|nr:sulfatase-like hydrolase/transferase [Pontiella agarivorans]MDZ8120041.1 sulfatase-like hydrolase/transferase [Pontiella agarivorans]
MKLKMNVLRMLALAFLGVCAQADEAEKPNIIILLGDDIGYEAFGCTGNAFAQTPNMDQLAKEGLVFDRLYTTVATCRPSRTELYTGLFPLSTGVVANTVRTKKPGVKSMVEFLEPLGYRVGLTGKIHFNQGKKFTKIPGFPVGANDDIAEYDLSGVKSFIEKAQENNQPFCTVVASVHAHHPWTVGTPQKDGVERVPVPEDYVDTPATREALVRHAAEVTAFDQQLADIRLMMDEMNLTENTILICLSEQGMAMPRGKWSIYEKGNRSLGIFVWPGTIQPGRTQVLSKYADILPTLIDYAGGPDPKLDGFSLRPVLEGKSQHHRDVVHVLSVNPTRRCALIEDDWKLVWSPERNASQLYKGFDEKKPENGEYTKKFAEVWTEWNIAAQVDPSAAQKVKHVLHPDEFEIYRIDRDYDEWNNLAQNPEIRARIRTMHERLNGIVGDAMNMADSDINQKNSAKKKTKKK